MTLYKVISRPNCLFDQARSSTSFQIIRIQVGFVIFCRLTVSRARVRAVAYNQTTTLKCLKGRGEFTQRL